ncbi:orotate phosphoribosyltransferase [Halomarina oriensis]|uniref:Orotate phosphoribosyltransferase n=1 Tax=Halomarina oriensis TaxID=671145 RepID=A0A6B0GTT7_9EURY|nr:orotate phosphoribosyltransferase [Halomarina oriensis]MWG35128.1 orotate phosphoribosyltransferase [Halomarina oriensis]
MDYRSVADLNADVRRLAWDLPHDVDRVVGVSRSAVLAVDLLQQTTGHPVADFAALTGDESDRFDGETVLLLTDWAETDTALDDQRRELAARSDLTVHCGAVYATERACEGLDYWCDVVEPPCSFEWRALHPARFGSTCMDIDGVLCRDPTPEENDDGPRYREFLRTVEPKYLPDERVGWLVTCRLERYRPETEQWLADHGVEYDELVMWDLPSKAVRDERGGHGRYKARVYERTDAELFVESSRQQAVVIARETERPVYCVDDNRMIPPRRSRRRVRPRPVSRPTGRGPAVVPAGGGPVRGGEGRSDGQSDRRPPPLSRRHGASRPRGLVPTFRPDSLLLAWRPAQLQCHGVVTEPEVGVGVEGDGLWWVE